MAIQWKGENMRDFKQYTIQQFEEYIKAVDPKRGITHIQIHHTWKPTKKDYKGESTIMGMWRYHTKKRGFQDIAQHFSVAPDGTIWDGRSLELDPAGIKGYNKGGLMFEIIGDFNVETLENSQLYSVTRAVVVCQEKFNLKNADVVFHREYTGTKSCPGKNIERFWFLNMVDRARTPIKDEVLPAIQRIVEGTFNDEPIDTPAYMINNMTYVPLRLLAEKLGASVHWDGEKYHIDDLIW